MTHQRLLGATVSRPQPLPAFQDADTYQRAPSSEQGEAGRAVGGVVGSNLPVGKGTEVGAGGIVAAILGSSLPVGKGIKVAVGVALGRLPGVGCDVVPGWPAMAGWCDSAGDSLRFTPSDGLGEEAEASSGTESSRVSGSEGTPHAIAKTVNAPRVNVNNAFTFIQQPSTRSRPTGKYTHRRCFVSTGFRQLHDYCTRFRNAPIAIPVLLSRPPRLILSAVTAIASATGRASSRVKTWAFTKTKVQDAQAQAMGGGNCSSPAGIGGGGMVLLDWREVQGAVVRADWRPVLLGLGVQEGSMAGAYHCWESPWNWRCWYRSCTGWCTTWSRSKSAFSSTGT